MSSPIQHKDQEATLVSTQDDLDKALPVDLSEFGSSQSAGTTFVPDADEAIMSAAFVSMQDRRSRLTSLLHHLTVDPEAPDQELPIAGLPAVENAGAVTRRARTGWQFARLFVVTGVTAALIGWGIILHRVHDSNTELPVNVQSTEVLRNSLPQENTEPPVAANTQSTTAPPLVHGSLPQGNAELPVAANLQSKTAAPPLVHDSLPQQNTEPPVAANVQSTTAAPPLVHDSLPQENTESPVLRTRPDSWQPGRRTLNRHRRQRAIHDSAASGSWQPAAEEH